LQKGRKRSRGLWHSWKLRVVRAKDS